MNILERNLSVMMANEHLNTAPVFEMPASFAMRWFVPGDEATWAMVVQVAERFQKIDETVFPKQYGNDLTELSRRVGFLMDTDENAVGTISAWKALYNEREYGLIHWVAIVPEMQGRGLGKPLMSAACRRLLELGHDRAYLNTSSARVPAINLYRLFGFEPVLRNEDERVAWQELMAHLK